VRCARVSRPRSFKLQHFFVISVHTSAFSVHKNQKQNRWKKRRKNLGADIASSERVKVFLTFGSRFFGGWFRKFWRARIFLVMVSLPLTLI
jgi:hypothetical protein